LIQNLVGGIGRNKFTDKSRLCIPPNGGKHECSISSVEISFLRGVQTFHTRNAVDEVEALLALGDDFFGRGLQTLPFRDDIPCPRGTRRQNSDQQDQQK
jgi:hypothetical protein